ncbi:MAG: TonB-dependent receptor [Chitinophagales bacterium]
MCFLCLHTYFLHAQASLQITLENTQNKAIADFPVWLENADLGILYSKLSDASGKVLFDGLPSAGIYTVFTQESNFYTAASYNNITLVTDKTTAFTINLTEKSLELPTVAIKAQNSSLAINVLDAQVSSTLSSKTIQEIPFEGRDINKVLYRLPNISQATGFFPEAPSIAINGANALYTNYLIDGLDNNENFLGGMRFNLPLGMVQNVEVLSNNFTVEYGLTANGIINLRTRSGTNETAGEVYYTLRPGKLTDAASSYAQRDLSGNLVKDGFQRHQLGCGVGGALKKDRTFYYVNVEYTRDVKDNLLQVPQLNIYETVQGENEFLYLSAKIDQHWNSKWQTSFKVHKGKVAIERQGGGLDGGISFPSAANTQYRDAFSISAKNTYLSKKWKAETNYQFGHFAWNYAEATFPQNPSVTVLDSIGNTIAFVGHPGYVFDEAENTHLLEQKFTFYHQKHRFKAGISLRKSDFSLFGGGNPKGNYVVQLSHNQQETLIQSGIGGNLNVNDLPTDVQVLQYTVELRPQAFQQSQQIMSIFAEDNYQISRKLSTNIGLRYDYDNLSKGGGTRGDFNNIAPRLSLNFQLNKNTALRAGYGIYYDKILYAVYSDALQFGNNSADFIAQLNYFVSQGILPENTNIDNIINEGNLVAYDNNVAYLQGVQASELQNQRAQIFSNEWRILNPNGYQNPYAHQFMLGLQRKTSDKTMFYIDLIHNRSYNLFRLRDLNAPAAYPIAADNVVVRSLAEADATRPVAILQDENGYYAWVNGDTLRGIARNVIMSETAGRANYYAANFTFTKEKAEDLYAFRFIYTLSYLENNTEDINFRAMDANNYDNEWGPSINDRTHIINALFNYYPAKNWVFNVAALLQSGQPINRIPDAALYGTTDLNGDGRSFGDAYVGNSDRSPGESRNNDRLPWSNTFDVGISYQISFAQKKELQLNMNVFNVLNAENLSGYSNNATQSNQIQVGAKSSGIIVRKNAAPPRQFQFGMQVNF